VLHAVYTFFVEDYTNCLVIVKTTHNCIFLFVCEQTRSP